MITVHEEMHQFTVVCRIALQLGWSSYSRGAEHKNLIQIGMVDFGLTSHQVSRAIGRARDEITEVTRLDRVRKAGRVNFPTRSDQLIAA